MDVTRRKFFMFLGAVAASPIIHKIAPTRLIFDMSMPVRAFTMDDLNRITIEHIKPKLIDLFYQPSPALWFLNKTQKEAYESITGDKITFPFIGKGPTYNDIRRDLIHIYEGTNG